MEKENNIDEEPSGNDSVKQTKKSRRPRPPKKYRDAKKAEGACKGMMKRNHPFKTWYNV